MKGTAKSKVVTSGRLTGGVQVQLARRRRVTPNPGPAVGPEPAYSLYSTDSEDQVTSLHKGLDRCAALLSGILEAEKAEALPGPPRAAKVGAAKSRPSTSLGKKAIKNTKTDLRSHRSVQRGAGSTTQQSAAPAARAKLRPPQRRPPAPLQPHSLPTRSQTLQRLPPNNPQCQTSIPPSEPQIDIPLPQPRISFPPPQLQTSIPLSQSQASIPPPQPQTSIPPAQSQLSIPSLQSQITIPSLQSQISFPQPQLQAPISPSQPQTSVHPSQAPPEVEHAREEEEFIPVRDVSAQSSAAGLPRSQIHMPDLQPEPGQVLAAPQGSHSGEEKVKTVQHLLGELKAVITGRGGAAERLLRHLEQTVSNIQTEPDLCSQNTQLRRRVRILNQQLKEREKAERQQNTETLCNAQASTLQEELAGAQSRLRELMEELAELRKGLLHAESQLADSEAENALIRTDLEATRSRLQDSEREKSELASLAQQRLEEIGNLKRILQSHDSSALDTAPTKLQRRPDPAEPATDRISRFLMSLGQLEPAHAEHAVAEREGSAPEPKEPTSARQGDASPHPGVGGGKPAHSDWAGGLRSRGDWRLETLSQCDAESVRSGWSTRSGSTFDTRDEAAFRDGLAALDASIASLQKTIQLDLGR